MNLNLIYLVDKNLEGNSCYDFISYNGTQFDETDIWLIPSSTGLYWNVNTTATVVDTKFESPTEYDLPENGRMKKKIRKYNKINEYILSMFFKENSIVFIHFIYKLFK